MTLFRLPVVAALLAVLVSAFVGCPRRDSRDDERAADRKGFTLVVSSAVVGRLEPCGCSPDMRGGVDRAAAAVEAIRAEGRPILLLDGGDRFFSGPLTADPLVAGQQMLQAETMAEITRAMEYDALVPGARDAAGGEAFFAGRQLPPLVDAGEVALPDGRPNLVTEVNGTRVGIIAIGAGDGKESRLAARAQAARDAGAKVVLLVAYRTFAEAREVLPVAREAGVDFVFATRAEVPETHESAALPLSQPPLFTVAARGEELLRIDVVPGGKTGAPFLSVPSTQEREAEIAAIDERIAMMRDQVKQMRPADPARRLRTEKLLELEERKARLANAPPPELPEDANAFGHAFVPMTPNLAGTPRVRALIEAFDARVSERNFAHAKANPTPCPEPQPGAARYVGDQACLDCHQDAARFWRGTSHAHAWETLEKKNKQYNVSCISCHVTGWDQPGGTCSVAFTEGRRDVQCESCHGPGSQHVASPEAGTIQRDADETVCRTCHDAENSPHFNYEAYRPQIIGPGHGLPLEAPAR